MSQDDMDNNMSIFHEMKAMGLRQLFRTCLILVTLVLKTTTNTVNGENQGGKRLECPDVSELGCKCSIPYSGYKEEHFAIRCNGVLNNGMIPDWGPLKGLPISELELHDNNITEIPDDAFNGLYFFSPLMPTVSPELDLYGNPVTTISQYAFRGIQANGLRVTFSDTQMTQVPSEQLRQIENLTDLAIYHSQLSNIELAFVNMHNLKKLFLVGNALILDHNSFSGLEDTLETLYLSKNHLTTFHRDAFKKLKSLKSLNLDENDIESLQANMFEGFEAQDFQLFSMTSNKISDIHVDAFKKVNTNVSFIDLNLMSNQIIDLDFFKHGCNSVVMGNLYDDTLVHLNTNPLDCNCELYDLALGGFMTIYGECASPSKYEGFEVRVRGASRFERDVEDIYGRLDGVLGELLEKDCSMYNLTDWNRECLIYRPNQKDTSSGQSISYKLWFIYLFFYNAKKALFP